MLRPPKRLKGWHFERSKALPKEDGLTDPVSTSIPLCNRLLELWSLGKLSATQVAEIGHLAMLEGCKSPEITSLAKCGNFGQNKGNAHRDMVAHFCKGIQISDPMPIAVDVLDQNTRKTTKEGAMLYLPHLMFSKLAQHYPSEFEKLFCFKETAAFWQGVEKVRDPKLAPPLTTLDKRVIQPTKTCPIFIHGDGVEYQTMDSLMTWSWGSMLSKQDSLASHLLLVAFPKCCSVATTWGPLHDWISWSFDALLKGKHPSKDPYGEALPMPLSSLADQPLTPGNHRCWIWSIQGDQEFFSNTLSLPHWQNKFPCHECDGQKPSFKGKECPEGKSVKLLREEQQRYVYVTPDQALLDKRSSHPLFSIPGVTTAVVRGDSLHILYSRGVGSHLAGSLLHYLCFFDGVKARQKIHQTRDSKQSLVESRSFMCNIM